jgi:hypothetical protein
MGMIWEGDRQNRELLSFHRKLLSIRKSHDALTCRDFTMLHEDSGKSTYAYLRPRGKSDVAVAINNSSETRCLTVRCGKIDRGSRLVSTDLLMETNTRRKEERSGCPLPHARASSYQAVHDRKHRGILNITAFDLLYLTDPSSWTTTALMFLCDLSEALSVYEESDGIVGTEGFEFVWRSRYVNYNGFRLVIIDRPPTFFL